MASSQDIPIHLGCALTALLLVLGLDAAILLERITSVQAQEVTTAVIADGTLGTVVTATGTTHDITGGTRPGNGPNLFHSFGQFDVGAGDITNFLNDSGLPTTNILSRVTGGDPSQIFGTIQTTGFGGANLFLMNPAGVLFGPTASLNIGGSFHVTTADVIRLADGTPFMALPSAADEVLTTAPPEAFGFLNENPAGITVDRSALHVLKGETMSLIGGPITIDGTSKQDPPLEAESGQVHLISVASPGDVLWSGDMVQSLPQVESFTELGSITIVDNNSLDDPSAVGDAISTAGNPGGTIVIRAGRLELTDASFVSSTRGPVDHPGLGFDIEVQGDLIMDRSEFGSSTFGAGSAGAVRITAGKLHMKGTSAPLFNSNIGSRAFSTEPDAGNGNDIDITAEHLILEEVAFINTTTFGPGHAGNIRVNVKELELNGQKEGVFISTSTQGSGNAGSLEVNAQSIRMIGGPRFAALSSQIASGGTGSAGDLRVTAQSIELLNGAQIDASVFSGSGTGGNIEVHSETLKINGLDANGFGAGIASSVEFPANGTAGNVLITTTGDLTVANGGFISVFSGGFGNSGQLDIHAGNVFVMDGGGIFSSNFGAGFGGNIDITANNVRMAGLGTPRRFHGIFALGGFFAQGAGNISITTGTLELFDGALITARTNGGGQAGNIDISADTLLISGADPTSRSAPFDGIESGIIASTCAFEPLPERATGDGGNIRLNIKTMELSHDGRVQALSTSSGNAGSIEIASESLSLTTRGNISTASTGTGDAGSVMIEANDITITGVATSANPFGEDFTGIPTRTVTGVGGDLTVTGHTLQVTDKGFLTSSTAGEGSAGNIDLALTDTLQVTNGGAISASTSGPGSGGTIAISADSVVVSGAGRFNGPDDEGSSVISSQTLVGGGDAGNIDITAHTIDVSDGAHIAADTFGAGRGGNITVTGKRIQVSGANEALRSALRQIPSISDKTVDLSPRSSVTANASSSLIGPLATGRAGSVQLMGGIVHIADGGFVSSETTSGALVARWVFPGIRSP